MKEQPGDPFLSKQLRDSFTFTCRMLPCVIQVQFGKLKNSLLYLIYNQCPVDNMAASCGKKTVRRRSPDPFRIGNRHLCSGKLARYVENFKNCFDLLCVLHVLVYVCFMWEKSLGEAPEAFPSKHHQSYTCYNNAKYTYSCQFHISDYKTYSQLRQCTFDCGLDM